MMMQLSFGIKEMPHKVDTWCVLGLGMKSLFLSLTTSCPQSLHTYTHTGYIITLYPSQGIKHLSRHSLSPPPPCVSETILVTRDAVLLQPSGDPVSSGLLLPWLHHSYLSVICTTTEHFIMSQGSQVFQWEMHIVSAHTHLFVHTCRSRHLWVCQRKVLL